MADFYHRGGNGPTTAGGTVLCIFIYIYIYNSETQKYNPKSEKVGTVWKTQIKKESRKSKFTLTCISLQTI